MQAKLVSVLFAFSLAWLTPEFCIANSDKAKAKGDVFLRNDHPSWPFYVQGEKIGIVKKEQEVEILQRKELNLIFKKYHWLKIKTMNSEGKMIEGWVYSGDEEKQDKYFEGKNQ